MTNYYKEFMMEPAKLEIPLSPEMQVKALRALLREKRNLEAEIRLKRNTLNDARFAIKEMQERERAIEDDTVGARQHRVLSR